MATKIDMAVSKLVDIANDNSHGYDQSNRWAPDYDCSSLVITCWESAGVNVKGNGAVNTATMYKAFIKSGFADVTNSVNLNTGDGLQKGDVLLRTGHTEMMVSSTQIGGAHISENGTIYADEVGDQTGNEISIKTYVKPSKPWVYVLRYPGGSSDSDMGVNKDDVVSGNRYLTMDEMKVNAKYITQYLLAKGWTLEAICGMLGNMQTESTINPCIWQSLNENNVDGGFGLVQWTPATNLISWATSEGLTYTDIDTQLERILYEMYEGIQYYPTAEFPESFEQFSQSTLSPEYLALAFLNNYERPADRNQPNRATQARYWYTYLSGINPEWKPDDNYKKRNGLSLLMMFMATRK